MSCVILKKTIKQKIIFPKIKTVEVILVLLYIAKKTGLTNFVFFMKGNFSSPSKKSNFWATIKKSSFFTRLQIFLTSWSITISNVGRVAIFAFFATFAFFRSQKSKNCLILINFLNFYSKNKFHAIKLGKNNYFGVIKIFDNFLENAFF